MAEQISKSEYQRYGDQGLMKPIIFCYTNDELDRRAVALNIRIAEKLVELKPNRRSFRLPGIVDQLIAELPKKSIIKDFDVLFNPDYQIDVLKQLIAACKKNEFAIIWPGIYVNGKLIYAQTGYSDYRVFETEKYDVTCIVE